MSLSFKLTLVCVFAIRVWSSLESSEFFRASNEIYDNVGVVHSGIRIDEQFFHVEDSRRLTVEVGRDAMLPDFDSRDHLWVRLSYAIVCVIFRVADEFHVRVSDDRRCRIS